MVTKTGTTAEEKQKHKAKKPPKKAEGKKKAKSTAPPPKKIKFSLTVEYAIHLVTHHKLSVSNALSATQNPCSRQNIYLQLRKLGYVAKSTVASSASPISDTTVTEPSTLLSPGKGAPSSAGCTGVQTEKKRRHRRTTAQAIRDNYQANTIKRQRDERYSIAFKKITTNWKRLKDDKLSLLEVRRQGVSIEKLCDKYNKEYLNLPGDKLLKRNVVTRAVKEGRAGESPKKNGRPPKVPPSLLRTSNSHITFMESSEVITAAAAAITAAAAAAGTGVAAGEMVAAGDNSNNNHIDDDDEEQKQQSSPPRKKKKMYTDFVGVTYNKTHRKYQSFITHNRAQHYLGRYDLAVDAAAAYDDGARQLKKSGWKVNFDTREEYELAKGEELEVAGKVPVVVMAATEVAVALV